MSNRVRRLSLLFAAAVAVGIAITAGTAPAVRDARPRVAPAPAHELETAVIPNPVGLDAANQNLQFQRIRAAGATVVRLAVSWEATAPTRRPAGFNPTNPGDPAYRWRALDALVTRARANGLSPVILVFGAPHWAQATRPRARRLARRSHTGPPLGPYKPSPAALGQFATALARRYSGSFRGLPRVRDFIAWNEPNNWPYLTPQRVKGKAFSPIWYRLMVNSFARGIHRVHPDNKVIAGTLLFNGVANRISPLEFMRDMLCMSKRKKARKHKKAVPSRPTCKQRATFDIWTHHPYTRGTPFHHAQNHDDVMLGDLPRMRALLKAAAKAHHIVSKHAVQLWVDEFSYDSRPPDPSPKTVSVLLQARYVSESLYQMWRSGVTVATWFLLRDKPVKHPAPHTDGQSGLWANQMLTNDLTKDRPKPALTAFRFPFVAYRHGKKRVSIWGRTPTSQGGRVTLQVGTATGWRTVGSARANRRGIFTRKFRYAKVKSKIGPLPKGHNYGKVVLADKPLSYWRLDDQGRVARDELGRNSGSYEGHPRKGILGIFKGDRAVDFANGSQVVLPPMAAPRTIELWLKTKTSGTLPFVSFHDAVREELLISQYRGYARASEGHAAVMSPDFVNDGQWHHIVFTVGSGGTARLYVDGTLNDESAWRSGAERSAANLAYDALLNRYYNGDLDEVAVYDHALTAAQVARHYDASGRVLSKRGMLRAEFRGEASWPFSLKRPKDRFVLAFG
jgi:hypothetical protein